MTDFITTSGKYSYLIIAIISFLLGTFSTLIIEFAKNKREKNSLIELFLNDIHENWLYTANLMTAADSEKRKNSGILLSFKGIHGLKLTDFPEYKFEVYNIKLLETEGLNLTKLLSQKSRKTFWKVYSSVKSAEEVRSILNKLPDGHVDLESYMKMFSQLTRVLSDDLLIFEKSLMNELSIWRKS